MSEREKPSSEVALENMRRSVATDQALREAGDPPFDLDAIAARAEQLFRRMKPAARRARENARWDEAVRLMRLQRELEEQRP